MVLVYVRGRVSVGACMCVSAIQHIVKKETNPKRSHIHIHRVLVSFIIIILRLWQNLFSLYNEYYTIEGNVCSWHNVSKRKADAVTQSLWTVIFLFTFSLVQWYFFEIKFGKKSRQSIQFEIVMHVSDVKSYSETGFSDSSSRSKVCFGFSFCL